MATYNLHTCGISIPAPYFQEYVTDKSEVRRYLGMTGEADKATELLIDECIEKLTEIARPKYVYRIFPLIQTENGYAASQCNIDLIGNTAKSYLCGCTQLILLGATLGIEADNLIRISQSTDMTKAVIYDACATDLIEKVCDRAQNEISEFFSEQNITIANRFSPGYGDLPLSLQRDICNILDLQRKIGVCLTNELLLLPTKSVTAFIGAGSNIQKEHKDCSSCTMKDKCKFKRKK